ncbi:hypothetical protein [Marinifilum caeruleilacunae]|uniref:STAS/SEC14 domain-containing protein n=1 Tax=Marinifilum caeruleilacunae TaxID=2499076 RepID=A0ABX1WWI1_9BACT|nr:hypothetical protein [Marinifilum caeruleilacunae]NOU60480.1 hypothetical protein [Marinifilum caeruleilacunae]
MKLEIDNKDFCIRLYGNVAYLKVRGMQDQEAIDFFKATIDQMLELYPHRKFASVCDLSELILSSPKLALQVNSAIKKICDRLDYEHNAVIIEPRFMQIVKAFIFSFYMRNTTVKTQIFRDSRKAFSWLDEAGYQTERLKEFLELKD